ncbi:uncharacterized protein LOC119459141 [Dermacentor silvarum]|uniref:uncharacterized protein LOC119459141 n=1 Tax=Dermacentor silvarum TaxID=543639 RepID=UPI002100B11B|nr:uncharacterized protein LOC119459141 [Dermacentor silvarum]
MALTNRDLFGIARGRCKESFCDCERYSVLRSANIRCDYCDHCPGSHGKLDELDSTPWTGDWHVRGTDATEASEPQDSGGNCANADLCTTAPGETVESSSLQRANDLSLLPTRSTNDPSLLPNTSTRDLSLLPSRSANDLSLPPTRSTNDLPLLPTKSQEFFEWLLENLPTFSPCVQPLLEGKVLSQRQHKQLCRQLRTEIALFLDENDIITSSNTAQCRWMYKALGDALVKMYPHLMWDEPKPESRLQKTRSQVYVSQCLCL